MHTVDPTQHCYMLGTMVGNHCKLRDGAGLTPADHLEIAVGGAVLLNLLAKDISCEIASEIIVHHWGKIRIYNNQQHNHHYLAQKQMLFVYDIFEFVHFRGDNFSSVDMICIIRSTKNNNLKLFYMNNNKS